MKRIVASLALLLFAGCAEQAPTKPSLLPEGPSPTADVRQSDREFSFTTIEVKGARATLPNGINAGGDVVGEYVDGVTGRTRGFLLRNGEFTWIDVPRAVLTQARGIGPGGEIVGTYRLPEDVVPNDPAPKFRGFVRTRQGEFREVMFRTDEKIYKSTIAQRILPDGTILGCRHENDTMESMRAVRIDGSAQSENGEIFASMHNGATPDLSRIVGLYTNVGDEHDMTDDRGEAYVIDDGVFKPFMFPGSTFTAAWDVNPQGDIVGAYRNATGVHGFVRTSDSYVSVDVPGAQSTQAFGINARGDIVGRFVAGGRTYGFLARRSGRD